MNIGDYIICSATEGEHERNADRNLIYAPDECIVLVVADGSGGSGYGEAAAEMVIRAIESLRPDENEWSDPRYWEATLTQLDRHIAAQCAGGESTAVVAALRENRIVGASVGDSRAMLVEGELADDLTIRQNRKPLLGSGSAKPVGFEGRMYAAKLLLATDGLLNYIGHPELLRLCREIAFEQLGNKLIDAVRLSSGALQDDATVIVANTDL